MHHTTQGKGVRHFDTRSLNEENFIASIGVYPPPPPPSVCMCAARLPLPCPTPQKKLILLLLSPNLVFESTPPPPLIFHSPGLTHWFLNVFYSTNLNWKKKKEKNKTTLLTLEPSVTLWLLQSPLGAGWWCVEYCPWLPALCVLVSFPPYCKPPSIPLFDSSCLSSVVCPSMHLGCMWPCCCFFFCGCPTISKSAVFGRGSLELRASRIGARL